MNPDLVDSFRVQNNNIMVDHFNKEDTRPIPNPVQQFKQAFEHFRESHHESNVLLNNYLNFSRNNRRN